MRDVGEWLVPPGDDPIPADTHARFVDHLAALCVAFRGWHDDLGLTTMTDRIQFFAPDTIAGELTGPAPDIVLRLADQGWARLRELSPELAALTAAVQQRPGALTTALAETPVSFLHGDWKLGNLGEHPDGRTILVDCAYPGSGPPCWDLLCDGGVDDVLAAFVLNHLDDPAAGLAELARVTRPGGALLATAYSNASRSAARDRVDAAAMAYGFAVPDWYLAMKANVTPLLGSAPAMARTVGAAGRLDGA